MYQVLFDVFLLLSAFTAVFFLYELYVFHDRTNLILEELYLLLRDGDGEAFFDVEKESYAKKKAKRDGELEDRKKMLEEELNELEKDRYEENIVATFSRLAVDAVGSKAQSSAQSIIDDDKLDYASGVYDLDHKKVDKSLEDRVEYAE